MKKRGNAGKRKINWSAFTGWFVLLSLVAAMIYIIVVLVLAPSHTQIVFERTKSDYVLMLLQCALGIVAIIGPNILQKRHNFIIRLQQAVCYLAYSLFNSCILSARALSAPFSMRHCQFSPKVEGVLIRASLPSPR